MILNTALSNSEGEHWCSVYWDIQGKGYFFDPLGQSPPPEWMGWLKRKSINKQWTLFMYNVQPKLSMKCGLYSCLFLVRVHFLNPSVHSTGIPRHLLHDVTEYNVEELLVKEILRNT